MMRNREIVNAGLTAAAALAYVILIGWFAALEWTLRGSGPVSGRFLMYIVPLLGECLAAALVGAGLGYLLRTDRPVVYSVLLGAALALFRWFSTTIYFQNVHWEDAAWIVASLLLPAYVAAAATIWLSRRRGSTPANALA
ncbi:MAG TPA: hypothetical protein VF756_10330 [Thermoanaerobaculia bacterium]